MQFSTTPTLEGQTIVEYCGVVTGEAVRAKIFFNIAMVVIIEVQGGGRDMNKVTHTPGDSPFTQAASGANVSQIESLLCPPG